MWHDGGGGGLKVAKLGKQRQPFEKQHCQRSKFYMGAGYWGVRIE
jgi:hypothetical protein